MGVTKIPFVAQFAITCDVSSYNELSITVKEYERKTGDFLAAFRAREEMNVGEIFHRDRDGRLLVNPYSVVQNIESRVESLTDELANFSVVIEKGHVGP